jgi:hypothetical protein
MPQIEEFLYSADAYCRVIETLGSLDDKRTRKAVHAALADLYAKALHLPRTEVETEEAERFDFPLPELEGQKYDMYFQVFDSYKLEEPVTGSLKDDILGVYQDLKEGLLLYEQGAVAEAVWQWKFSFATHWGHHAANAIRALHSVNFLF